MRWPYQLRLRLFSLFRRQVADSDLSEELQFHLQQQIDDYVAAGMDPQEARRAALRSLGPVEPLKEECREMRNVSFIENTLQDVRFGFRVLRRSPGFSVLAILCLTLGIGSNAAVFSWIEGILLRPFPMVTAQDRMMAITGTNRGVPGAAGDAVDMSWPDLLDLQKNCTLFDWFIVDRITGTTLSIGDRA